MNRNLFYNIIKWSVAVIAVAVALSANAKPAKKGIISALQPDGTTVAVTIQGDEFSQLVTTEDGFLLLCDENGYYTYAVEDQYGDPVASGIKAVDVGLRTSKVNDMLKGVNKMRMLDRTLENLIPSEKMYSPGRIPAFAPRKEKQTRGYGLFDDTYPVKGKQKALVILVQFSDKKFDTKDPYDYFSRMLNEKGFKDNGGTGSARDYFLENSMNQFQPEFDVYGPVTLAKSYSYYGKNNNWGQDMHPEEMIVDACRALDGKIDFAQYDRSGDGKVDNVYVFYAGYGEADGGGANTVWPHSYNLMLSGYDLELDGKLIDRYACSNETDFASHKPDGVGTFVHEFSHVMGLPDLYSTDTRSRAFTPGSWSALDYGPYNNEGRTPPNYSIFERNALGWITPEVLNSTRKVTVEPITTNKGYVVYSDSPTEFFLFENRQQTGWDKYIPGHGMLVWHIDYVESVWVDNAVNNTVSHQYVDLVEADNNKSEASRSADSFPGTANVNRFNSTTNPRFITWDKQDLGLKFDNIAEANGLVTFDCVLFGTPGSNAVEDVVSDNNVDVYVSNGVLAVNAPVNANVFVYDLVGRKIATISGAGSVSLPGKGVYVISYAGGSRKVVY